MNVNGDRLKTARIFRNMSISDLADKTSVTKQAISQYEKNQITPKSEVLFQIISALKFPLSFFTDESDSYQRVEIENTFFRALNSAKTLDLDTQRVKTGFIFEMYRFLDTYLNFPQIDIPLVSEEDLTPEEIANNLRDYWNLGRTPVTNMVSLLEKKGIIVSSINTDSVKIDAFTQIENINGKKLYCVVLGNDKQSMVRRNFDAAHELGHIIMHRDFPDVSELSKEEYKAMEAEANNFAAAFLLPREAFFTDLLNPTSLNSYLKLKEKWKVSISAMVMRARHIERISPLQYQNLMKQISYKKWRKNEPFDDVWQMHRPQLFKKSIEILIQNDILTPSQFVTEFGKFGFQMNSEDIERLIDLDKGTLAITKGQEETSLVVSLKNYRL